MKNKQIKILELFAGTRSIGKEAEKLGCKVYSIDIKDFENIDLVFDIEYLKPENIPFIPSIIWASPPCTTYSVAAIGHHRKKGCEISAFAKKSDRIVINLLSIIKHYQEKYNTIWYIENPRGLLRKMDFMQGIQFSTVWYCQYGFKVAKPTDIFSNNIYSVFNASGWIPRKQCKNHKYINGEIVNRSCNHESAVRGARSGTQNLSSNKTRSIVPAELCKEILTQTIKKLCHQ